MATYADIKQQVSDSKIYELSSTINSMMIDASSHDRFREYFYFKSFVKDIRLLTLQELTTPSPEYFPSNPRKYYYVYAGKIPLYVSGKRFLAENMEDQYLWTIYIAGSKGYVSKVYIKSGSTVDPSLSGGEQYFIHAGFKLELLSCKSMGSENYGTYYKAYAPNKQPIILGISKSAGSGGTWYQYEISWEEIKISDLDQQWVIGFCDIHD